MSYTSSLKEIKHGVPQGSVLGPLLFLLFINDLLQALQEAKVVLFADDTNTLLTDSEPLSLNEKIQKVRKQLDNWFHANQIIINTEKIKALFFQGKRPNPIHRPVFSLNGSVKFLGIYITENLCWATHTHHVCQKLNKALYLIKFLPDSAYLF
jgi:hypothetical protein